MGVEMPISLVHANEKYLCVFVFDKSFVSLTEIVFSCFLPVLN